MGHDNSADVGVAVGIGIATAGGAQVFGVEVAVLVQRLCVTDNQLFSRQLRQSDFHQTCHVLTEVEHNFALGRDDFLPDGEPPGYPHRFRFLGHDAPDGVHPLEQRGLAQRFCGKGEILRFTVVDFREADRAALHIPVLVSTEDGDGAVFVFHSQHGHQRGTIAVDIWSGVETQLALVPAVAQGDGDFVISRFHEVGDIIGLILDAVVVGSPARREEGVACFGAVDSRFIHAAGGGVEPRTANRAAQRKTADEHRAEGLFHREAVCDPARLPGLIHQPRFKPACCLMNLAQIVPCAHLHMIDGEGHERLTAVGDQDGLLSVHPAALPDKPSFAHHLNLISDLEDVLAFTF